MTKGEIEIMATLLRWGHRIILLGSKEESCGYGAFLEWATWRQHQSSTEVLHERRGPRQKLPPAKEAFVFRRRLSLSLHVSLVRKWKRVWGKDRIFRFKKGVVAVWVWLPVSKTDPKGNGALRRHGCTCHVKPKRCPVKAARKIYDYGTKPNTSSEDPFLCAKNLEAPTLLKGQGLQQTTSGIVVCIKSCRKSRIWVASLVYELQVSRFIILHDLANEAAWWIKLFTIEERKNLVDFFMQIEIFYIVLEILAMKEYRVMNERHVLQTTVMTLSIVAHFVCC